MSIRARLNALDERLVYRPARRQRGRSGLFLRLTLTVPLLALIVVAWARSLQGLQASLAGIGLYGLLSMIARFWFGQPPRR